MRCFVCKKEGVGGRPTLGAMAAPARLLEKRVSEPWSLRISPPGGGEETGALWSKNRAANTTLLQHLGKGNI